MENIPARTAHMAPRTPIVLDAGPVGASPAGTLASKTPIEAMIAIPEENSTNSYRPTANI